MSQKRKRAEQARARRKSVRERRPILGEDGQALPNRYVRDLLESAGLAERTPGGGWRRTPRTPESVAAGAPAAERVQRRVSELEVRAALERLEALEQAEAEQAEVDAAAEALGWLDYR